MKTSQIEQLFRAMSEGEFSSLTFESGKVRCRLVRRPPSSLQVSRGSSEPSVVPAAQTETAPLMPNTNPVISERVGVFSFGKRAPLTEGQRVKKGEVLGIIKGISMQDNVLSPRAGILTSSHVQEGDIVEFGRLLFSIADEPAASPQSSL